MNRPTKAEIIWAIPLEPARLHQILELDNSYVHLLRCCLQQKREKDISHV
jgi:hypothetical protein